MSYIKEIDVLPEELLELIQNYIDGEYIYIPRKECIGGLGGKLPKVKGKFQLETQRFIRSTKRVYL